MSSMAERQELLAGSPFASPDPDFAARMARAEGASVKREAIIRAALVLFAEQGYHATSLRRLAQHVGVEAGSLYNHIDSKHELLTDMLVFSTDELLRGVGQLLDGAPVDPAERLRIAVAAHIGFHCVQREQVLVLDREMRSIPTGDRPRVMGFRGKYEAIFRGIAEEGIASGSFRPHDTSLSVKAIMRLGAGTAAWFQGDGRSSALEVGDFYADLFVRGLAEPGRHPAVIGV